MRRTAPPIGTMGIVAIVGVAGIGAGLALMPAAPAQAHNYVVSTTPAEGETLTSVPESFVITTNENMLDLSGESAGFAIQITDARGLFYGDGCITVGGTSMSMPAALGDAGPYTMTYQFVSADGHSLSSSHAFAFAPTDGSTVQAGGLASPPVCGETVVEPNTEPSADPSTEPVAPIGEQPATDTSAAAETGGESTAVLGVVAAIGAGLAIIGALVAIGVWRSRRTAAHQGAPT
jgi:methionine-rich copper-binding protein CopC